ncbi:MAG: ABC transporter permease [Chloroflexi bacterium]|nr:MAG: ABC transporter permease [Chloroflexota bacterium]
MRPILAFEYFKLRKWMTTWILALILVGLIVLLYSVLWSISGQERTFGSHNQFTSEDLRRALFLQSAVPFSLSIVGSFGIILSVVLAAGAVGSEYSWGTVRLVATASRGRIRMIAAKLAMVCAFIAAGALAAVIVGVTYSAVITFANGGANLHFVTGSFLLDQLESYLRTLFVIAPYTALAFSLAVIGRSTMAGIGGTLGLILVEPIIGALMREAGGWWHEVPRAFPNSNLQIILAQNKLPDVLPRFGPSEEELARRGAYSWELAALLLVVYTVVFLVLALVAFRRRDITTG